MSPVIKILDLLVSKASPVESSIDGKIAFVEFGDCKGTYELHFILIEFFAQIHSMFGSSRLFLLLEKTLLRT